MPGKSKHNDFMHLASLAAHQIKAPVDALKLILRTVLGGYAGKVSPRQQELLQRANECCSQAYETINRILYIARSNSTPSEAQPLSNWADTARQVILRYESSARARHISFEVEIPLDAVWVPQSADVWIECFDALLNNALKYTPDHGRVRVEMTADATQAIAGLKVEDSGVGISPADRERVFEPFYRSGHAEDSSRPGTGLGLTFVHAVVDRAGGSIEVLTSRLGGTCMSIEVPLASPAAIEQGERAVKRQMRVVIVGGVAAGPKVASKVIRLDPHAEVTIVEKGKFLSYAGCGLPYYVSGVVTRHEELMSTPVGVPRDPIFFQQVKNVHVMNQTEALEVDREGKRVRLRDLIDTTERWLEYDRLVLATGAMPIVPKLEGIDLGNVFTLHGVRDAEGIRSLLNQGKSHDVVIIGGGLIGVEITEALVNCGCRVTIVEMLPQLLRMLDWEIARLVEKHLEGNGVRVLLETTVKALHGEGKVKSVETTAGVLPADMVIVAAGVRPNVKLAVDCGLEIGSTGGIKVDQHMQTSDPDIFAAGDCVEMRDILTGKECYVPLGSTANKQGRVAAMSVCGREDSFPGVLGSTVCRLFDFCIARTGMTEANARKQGYDVVTVLAPGPDRAHFMPDARILLLKLVVDRTTRKLLGAQAVGPGAGDKRIDIAAMALTAGLTVDQLANADLCYAPPYSPAMDNIITAANVARNKLDGVMDGISPMQVHQMLEEEKDFVFLDVRSPGEHEQVRLPGATLIPLGALRGRLSELPRDKEIITFCQISLRGYEAALVLKAAGFDNVRVMDGGVSMWPYEKLTGA